ncbi:YdcF family protein [Rhizobium sp. KDH_Rht_773_N]
MFVLSKLVWILAQPFSLAFFGALLALVAGLLRWRLLSALGAAGAVSILFVTLYTTSGNYLLQQLEERFPRPAADPEDVKCMIVLGGAFQNEVNTARHGIEFADGADRFIEALRLAQKYPQSRILVSGGDGSLSGTYEGDAVASRRFFPLFGVGKERLVEEAQSRTTYENARNTKEFLAQQGLSDCLLITSAFHMPRSVGLFRKLGIEIVPWPTDYRTTGNVALGLDFTQPSLNGQNLGTAIREWYGLAGYYLAGRTSALFPG